MTITGLTDRSMAGDLVLDVGNTRVKMGWFVEGRCVRMGTVDPGDTAAVKQWLAGFTVHRIAIGSVAHDHAWHADLGELGPLVVLRGDMPSPLGSRYTTPGTLGVDRLANAVAAHATFPGRAALAISLGTCVTYDVVTAAGEHLGGAISPGMHLRSRAMHTFSARLPETDLSETVEELGTSTQGALLAGIHHGIAHELHGWVQTLRQQHDGLAVVLTGGDALRFSRALKSGIFADPSLTLRGLHALLSFALLADGVAVGDPGG